MKKMTVWLALLVILTGCAGKREDMDRIMTLRATLLACQGCSYDAAVTADYGDKIHSFTLSCEGENNGDMTFAVTQPETIAGVTGKFTGEQGFLTFDDKALAFPLLADGQITPVSGPWILLKTMLGGYLTACGREGDLLHLTIDDSYEDDALRLDIWLDGEDNPIRAEIVYDDRRIVTMEIENFVIR